LAVDTTEPLTAGAIFSGRYRINRCIKSGGMGAIYEVTHLETRRRRVLKTMLPDIVSDPDFRERFRLEATIAADIESDHIVEVFDAGVDEESQLPFFVMEALKGQDLGAVLRERGRLVPEEVVALLGQAALALDKTHAAGIVHRDLKPENLFLTSRDDGSPRIKILDFGIAKLVAQSTQAATTRNLGTPQYMSPEQIRGAGDIDHRADIYALGLLAFTFLVGHSYWELEKASPGGYHTVLLGTVEGTREPASRRAVRYGVTLRDSFDAWFSRATAKEVSLRFDSAGEAVEELAEALGVTSAHRPPRANGSTKLSPNSGPLHLAGSPGDTTLLPLELGGPRPRVGGSAAPREPPPISPTPAARPEGRRRVALAVAAVLVASSSIAVFGLVRGRLPPDSASRSVQIVQPASSPQPAPVAPAIAVDPPAHTTPPPSPVAPPPSMAGDTKMAQPARPTSPPKHHRIPGKLLGAAASRPSAPAASSPAVVDPSDTR
jgi:serine/threonine-protein kinase